MISIRDRYFVYTLTLILTLFTSTLLKGQPTYDFKQINEPYKMLTKGSTTGMLPGPLTVGLNLEGDSLSFYGGTYYPSIDTPMVIYGNGLLRVDNKKYTVAIDGLLMEFDSLDERSGVFYQLEEINGETVLQIEWRYAAIVDVNNVAGDYVNMQIWLYMRSGIVEMRYGPHQLQGNYGTMIGDGPFIGIFRSTPWSRFQVLQRNWLTGNASTPTYNTEGIDLPPISGIPPEGTVFRFTPRIASGVQEEEDVEMKGYRIYPNPARNVFTLQSLEELEEVVQVTITDALGRTISTRMISAGELPLEIELPRTGFYFCTIIGKDRTERYPVISQ
ncbi:MAG: T9SS type A sorting domain-containing protein [Candidatus Kapaibacterium sp.]